MSIKYLIHKKCSANQINQLFLLPCDESKFLLEDIVPSWRFEVESIGTLDLLIELGLEFYNNGKFYSTYVLIWSWKSR